MNNIGDDVSKDEAIKVAENLVIEGNTTMVKTAGLPTWSGEMISEKTEDDNDEISTSVNEKKLPIYQIGDTFDLDAEQVFHITSRKICRQCISHCIAK